VLIASAIYFANVNENGEADYNNASNVNGVRPLLRVSRRLYVGAHNRE
jgi:hypothetical protein